MRVTFAGACLMFANALFIASAAAAEIPCGDVSDTDTCDDKDKCAVVVSKDSAGNWKVSPYNLIVAKQNTKIMFLLLQGGGKFVADPSKKNGLEIKTNGAGQFSDQYPTDKYNKSPPQKAEGPIWHVKFKNHGGGEKDIKYWLTFQDGESTVTCDPLVNNSEPIVKGKRKSNRR